MFVYEKKLEYPLRIKNSNPALAKFICSQYGGPDGELGASLRYLSQRYAMPYPELSAILTDIGTEELGHLEMVGTIVYQLTRSMTPEQIRSDMGSRGGLLGISGVSNDMRDLEKAAAEGNDRAQLAIDIFIHELVRYIGGYAGVMGGIDAIAFTGGIGENSESVRNTVMERLKFFGIQAAPQSFRKGEICRVTADESKVAVYVIPANEELGIARNVARMMEQREGGK